MRVAVAQLGPRRHYAEARVLHAAGLLDRLFTDLYAGDKPRLVRAVTRVPWLARLPDVRRWLGRAAPGVPAGRVTSFDMLGIRGVLGLRRARDEADRYRLYAEIGATFQRAVIRHGLGSADTLLASTGAAAQLMAHASATGVHGVLQQFEPAATIGREIVSEERARWPGAELQPSSEIPAELWDHLLEEERRAIADAGTVLVASRYTERSMARVGYPTHHVRLLPLAVDLAQWTPRPDRVAGGDGRLVVVYAGQIDLRKGVLYLIEAVRRLRSRNIVLKLAGTCHLREDLVAPPGLAVELLGPVPRPDMPELMRSADVFVFPTLGEGFGLVQVEALACGTPVIATTECGEVVEDGINGHIVPPRDPDAIARWLDHYAARPGELLAMRRAARERAEQFSVVAYGERLLQVLSVARPDQLSHAAVEASAP
ncbi:MAG: glycosyltransferase [Geminicoccaceae bacterium]|nr:glycosyltransferase [Geminicoccaceae bacterium]